MLHWNQYRLVAIHIQTTGKQPFYHELLSVTMLPLTRRIEPDKSVLPLELYIVPEHIKRIDKDWLKNQHIIRAKFEAGVPLVKSLDIFEHWFNNLKIPTTKYGTQKRILPLVYDWAFVQPFLEAWLGHHTFHYYIDRRARDILTTLNFINDRSWTLETKVRYPKNDLRYLANQANCDADYFNDPLQRTMILARIYRHLLGSALLV